MNFTGERLLQRKQRKAQFTKLDSGGDENSGYRGEEVPGSSLQDPPLTMGALVTALWRNESPASPWGRAESWRHTYTHTRPHLSNRVRAGDTCRACVSVLLNKEGGGEEGMMDRGEEERNILVNLRGQMYQKWRQKNTDMEIT